MFLEDRTMWKFWATCQSQKTDDLKKKEPINQ